MGGFVGIPDELLEPDGPFWLLTDDQRALLFTLYATASRQTSPLAWRGMAVIVRRGEVVRTEASLGSLMGGWSRRAVRSGLARLEALGLVSFRLVGGRRKSPESDESGTNTQSGNMVFPDSHAQWEHGLRVITLRYYYGSEEPSLPVGTLVMTDSAKKWTHYQTSEETDHAATQKGLLPEEPLSPFARFVSETWADVADPPGLERKLAAAFPGVDLEAQARRAALWEEERPSRRKKNHASFLRKWLTNALQGPRGPERPVEGRQRIVGFDRENRPIYEPTRRRA